MTRDWKILVKHAERPYLFEAVFVLSDARDASALESRYLYGDGDLAAFLDEVGADSTAIWNLLGTLHQGRAAEISLEVTDESMEVLARDQARR